MTPPAELLERGSACYPGKAVEWIGYTLIAFDLADTATGALAGPDTGLLGAPLVAAASAKRNGSAVVWSTGRRHAA